MCYHFITRYVCVDEMRIRVRMRMKDGRHEVSERAIDLLSRIARPVWRTSSAINSGNSASNSVAALSKTSARRCRDSRDQTPDLNTS